MSSPIAKATKNKFDKLLISFHRKYSHNNRVDYLANEIANLIHSTGINSGSILDIGCGDFSISTKLKKLLNAQTLHGIDIHPNTFATSEGVEGADVLYSQFDGINIPFKEKQFEVGLLSDVLHHIETTESQAALIREALRVCKYLVIKDHFEYGHYSRTMLRLMDIVGNLGYGISIPEKYMTSEEFETLLTNTNSHLISKKVGLNLYRHNFTLNLILRSKWQFIAVCKPEQ